MTTKTVELQAGTVEYEDLGSGAPIVFCHGFLVDGRIWMEVASLLAQSGFRCLVPTLPMGAHRTTMNPNADLSPEGVASVVADFCAMLGLENVTLVGNDSGGAVAQLVATQRSERIARLVLTNCDALEAFPPRGYGYLKLLPQIPGAMWLLAQAGWRFPRLARLPFAFGGLTKRPLSLSLLRSWSAPSAENSAIRRDVSKFLRGIETALTLRAAKELAHFGRPVLLLWGEADKFFTLSLARRLQAMVPDARLEIVPGGRTYVSIDDPELVAAGIAAFMREGSNDRRVGT